MPVSPPSDTITPRLTPPVVLNQTNIGENNNKWALILFTDMYE